MINNVNLTRINFKRNGVGKQAFFFSHITKIKRQSVVDTYAFQTNGSHKYLYHLLLVNGLGEVIRLGSIHQKSSMLRLMFFQGKREACLFVIITQQHNW